MSPTTVIFLVILSFSSFDTAAATALKCDGVEGHSCGGAVPSVDDACIYHGQCDRGLSLLQTKVSVQRISIPSRMPTDDISHEQFQETLRSLPSDLTVKQLLAQEDLKMIQMKPGKHSKPGVPSKKNPLTTWVACLNAAGALMLFLLGAVLAQGAYYKCAGEFLGTFILVFTVGCNVLLSQTTWGVTSIAFSLMVSIYALAPVCGANFNPAVSLALGINKSAGHLDCSGLSWREVASYICCQLSGALFAGVAYSLLLMDTVSFGPQHKHSLVEAGFAEMLYTLLLVFVVLNTAVSREHAGNNQFYGLAIASTVIAGGYGAGSISGGCFNPAVAFGLACNGYHTDFLDLLAYVALEALGCVLAFLLYAACRPEDFGKQKNGGTSLLAEFIGPFFVVLTVGLNVSSGSPAGAYSIAASLLALVFALGTVSGAHFNPAVTVAILCSGRDKIDLPTASSYVIVQLLGGIVGGFTSYGLMGKAVALAPGKGATIAEALVGEFIFTFLLAYVVLCVATVRDDKKLNQMFGLAIGGVIVAGGFAIGPISGASLNPAVSFGLAISDLVNAKDPWPNMFSYAGMELAGGILAAIMFLFTHQTIAYNKLDEK